MLSRRGSWRPIGVAAIALVVLLGAAPASAQGPGKGSSDSERKPADRSVSTETKRTSVDREIHGRSWGQLRAEAVQAEQASANLERANANLERNANSATNDKALRAKIKDQFKELQKGRQGQLASLAAQVRQLPPSMPVDMLTIYEVNDRFAFAMPGVEVTELLDRVVTAADGTVLKEEIGMLQEKNAAVEETRQSMASVPQGRSFGVSRYADGWYSWRSGNLGQVRIYWSKDFKDEVGNWGDSPDWMVYSGYTEAKVNEVWWEGRFIYDVDTINGVTSGSLWAHHSDTPNVQVNAPQSGCSSITSGLFGLEIGLELCAETNIKSDRVGGKHVEFRNSPVWWSPTYPVIDDLQFWTGYSQEVRTESNYAMYWWDYGDACFTHQRDLTVNDCDEEVIR